LDRTDVSVGMASSRLSASAPDINAPTDVQHLLQLEDRERQASYDMNVKLFRLVLNSSRRSSRDHRAVVAIVGLRCKK